MRWNCPHCSTALSIADEKLSSSWSFSRCVHCNGYSLVRRSDLNLIRYDEVPMGQEVILPSSIHSSFSGPSGSEQTDLLPPPPPVAEEKPMIRPAARRPQLPASRPASLATPKTIFDTERVDRNEALISVAAAVADATVKTVMPPPFRGPRQNPTNVSVVATIGAATLSPPPFILPEPLPDVPEPRNLAQMVPLAIATCSLIIVGTGLFLYQQGQRVHQRAQSKDRVKTAQSRTIPVAKPQIQENKSSESRSAPPRTPTEWTSPNTAVPAPVSIVPLKPSAIAPAKPAGPPARVFAPPALAIRPPKQAKAPAGPARPRTFREILAQEDAPEDEDMKLIDGELPPASGIVVQVKDRNVFLRSGPGSDFPILGAAAVEGNYLVQEWRGQWFRIALPPNSATGVKTAWVRNDLVRLITLD